MAFSGARLKQLRIRKRESLQQVANAVDASKAHIWELEKGDSRNPSIDLLRRMAQHFDVSIAYLVEEDPDAPEEEEQLVAMFRELKDLDPDDREMLNTIMRQMRERKKEAEPDSDAD
ncbi:MAG: helix-turn-helix domain-containing protein [Alphaproteobacteria bacterium]